MSEVGEFWSVPRMWEGKTVAIFASGAGMTHEVAGLVRGAGLPIVVVNSTVKLAPFADVLYAADPEWWAHPENDAGRAFRGLKVSVSAVRDVLRLRNTGVTGFDPDPSALRTGGNSGYQALHLAAHTGAVRVLLCGFNMTGPHWHGDHPRLLRTTAQELYARFRERFETLVEPLKALDIDVVNVTPGSALTCFRKASLEDELWRVR